ncbi:hypothetical protein L227DRAFT_565578, partial [Lentinus tigrinus ALCF2SS1-6]
MSSPSSHDDPSANPSGDDGRPRTPNAVRDNPLGHDPNPTPAKASATTTAQAFDPPKNKTLRPVYTGLERMQFNTVQVTVDRFFEQYLPGTTSPPVDSSGEDAPREDIPPKDIPGKYLGKLHYVSDFKKLTPEWKVNTEICRIAKKVASCDIDDDREPPIAVRDVSNWSVGDKASSTTEVKAAATPPSSGQATDDKTAEDADTATRTDVGVFFNDRRYDGFVFKDPDEFMKKSKMHKNNKAQRKDW